MTEEWERHARETLRPAIASSSLVLVVNPGGPDPKVALELGYGILLGKPVVVVSWPGRDVPPGLLRVADAHIVLTAPLGTDAGTLELMAKLAALELGPRS